MTTLIVLFNLKSEADKQDYEAWAKSTDLPTVRNLKSIADFQVFRSSGLLGSDNAPPYEYVEVIQISDMASFGDEVASDVMQKVAGEFQQFADNPTFIMSENLEQA